MTGKEAIAIFTYTTVPALGIGLAHQVRDQHVAADRALNASTCLEAYQPQDNDNLTQDAHDCMANDWTDTGHAINTQTSHINVNEPVELVRGYIRAEQDASRQSHPGLITAWGIAGMAVGTVAIFTVDLAEERAAAKKEEKTGEGESAADAEPV